MEQFTPHRGCRGTAPRRVLTAALGLAACAVFLPMAAAQAAPITDLVLSEIMYNPAGPDAGNEWIELFNGTGATIDLSGYSLGWGGADYTTGTLQLSGTIDSGAYFTIGNGVGFDLDYVFSPQLENAFPWADGVALFDVPASSITPTTVPIDAVIYDMLGIFGNSNGLLDPTGNPGAVDVVGAAAGQSIALSDTGWAAESTPSPGSGTLEGVPEPRTGLLLLLGLAGLALGGSRSFHRDTKLGR